MKIQTESLHKKTDRLSRKNLTFFELFFFNVIIVLLVALSLSYGLYRFSTKKYEANVIGYHNQLLLQMQKNTDEFLLKNSETLSLQSLINLEKEGYMLDFFYSVNPSSDTLYTLYSNIKEIATYHDILSDIVLYSSRHNIAITKEGIKFLSDEKNVALYATGFLPLIESGVKNGWFILDSFNVASTLAYNKNAAYIQTYPFGKNISQKGGAMVMYINGDKLISQIFSALHSPFPDYQVVIFDHSGYVFASSNRSFANKNISDLNFFTQSISTNGIDFYIENINNEDTAVSSSYSSKYGWYYAVLTPYNAIFDLSDILSATIFTGILTSSAGLVLIWVINRYLFSFVGSLKKFVNSNKKTLHQEQLKKIIFNKNDDYSLLDSHLFFSQPYFCAISINTANTGIKAKQLMDSIYSYNKNDLLIYPFEIFSNEVLTIINFDNQEQKHSIIEHFHHNLSGQLGFVPNFGVSSIAKSHEMLADCYMQAKSAEKYFYVFGDKNILYYEDVKAFQDQNNPVDFNMDSINGVISAMRQNNFAAIPDETQGIIAHLRTFDYENLDISQITIYIAGIFLTFSYEIDSSRRILNAKDLILRFSEVKNLAELESTILWVSAEIQAYKTAQSSHNHGELVKKAVDYIKSNLENDISLEIVAEYLGVSDSHLSRVFKNETGGGFVNFFQSARLELAEELLKNSKLSIDEISQKVGYRQTSYFIKKFKEKNTLTPKQYKIKYYSEKDC